MLTAEKAGLWTGLWTAVRSSTARVTRRPAPPAPATLLLMAIMTGPVRRWSDLGLAAFGGVASRRELAAAGVPPSVVAAHLAAGRWRRLGRAILLHNGPPTREQRERAALISCGPRSVLTSFTATARWGVSGWDRYEIHVLAPVGTRKPAFRGLVLHRSVDWDAVDIAPARRLHRPAPALLIAAASFAGPRPGCAVLAAGVQQQVVRPDALHAALDRQPKLRHYRNFRLALWDIEQGSHALSELDFVDLCRRHKLPLPIRQAVRVERNGRRRYLDAAWKRRDGTILAAEVDGAIHLAPREWIADQLRQNEVVLDGTTVLRYPSVVMRCDEAAVVDQLRRGLLV